MDVRDFGATEQAYREQLFSSYERVVEIGRMVKSGLAETGLVDAATMAEYHCARHCCFVSIENLPEYQGEQREAILRIHRDLVATMDFPDGPKIGGNKSLARLELDRAMNYAKEIELEAA